MDSKSFHFAFRTASLRVFVKIKNSKAIAAIATLARRAAMNAGAI
jgi:hypothetical protein